MLQLPPSRRQQQQQRLQQSDGKREVKTTAKLTTVSAKNKYKNKNSNGTNRQVAGML
jgi:hypothetical protein